METKTSVAAVKPLPIYEENTKDFKDAKKTKTDMLLHLYHNEKHIFLYFVEESSVALSTLCQGLEKKYMEVILLSEIISKKMDEFDKLKSRLTPEGDTFVIDGLLENNVLDGICKEPASHQDASIRAVCFMQQVDDDKKKPLKSFHHYVMEWMKQNNKGYLEVSDRVTGSDTRQGVTDTDEDSAPAFESVDLERYPFFRDPLFPWRDPKKSPELLYILNKIRRAQRCPEEFPTGIHQSTTSQSEEYNDLEVDAPPSDRQRSPLFFEGETSESMSQVHVSKKPKRDDTNLKNVRFLLQTQAAQQLLSMDFDSNTVIEAISSYTKSTGNVEFDVEDLFRIMNGEDPKKRKVAVQN